MWLLNLFKKREPDPPAREISFFEENEIGKTLKAGASPDTIEWLKEQYLSGSMGQDEFLQSLEGSVYVTDLPYLLRECAPKEAPEGSPKAYPYPAAFLGAVFGDIAGSAYEGMAGQDVRGRLDFGSCIVPESRPTDDTILACATAISDGPVRTEDRPWNIGDFRVESAYPFAGTNPFTAGYREAFRIPYENPSFGASFCRWAESGSMLPYGSMGNGAAARAVPLADMITDLNELVLHAAASAAATHNHCEGVKGAAVTAAAAWMAYAGYSREQIFQYIKGRYEAVPSGVPAYHKIQYFTMDELQTKFGPATCRFSVPAAAVCFHESESFADVMDNVLSFEGDTDTIGAIAGAIAGAYYGVPEKAIGIAMERGPLIGPMFRRALERAGSGRKA